LLTNIIGLPIKIFIQLTFSPNIFLKVHGQIFSNALAKYLPCAFWTAKGQQKSQQICGLKTILVGIW
jgi:hypothetical protein